MRFWRKINRGLILTLLVLVGVTVYLAVLEAKHAAERPAVEAQAKAYVQTMAKVLLLPEKYRVAKPDMPQKELDAAVKAAGDALRAFYPAGSRQAETAATNAANVLTQQAEGTSSVCKSYSVTAKVTKVRFNGDTATATLEYTENAAYVQTGASDAVNMPSQNGNVTGQITLAKIDGTWKVTYCPIVLNVTAGSGVDQGKVFYSK